MSYNSPAGRGGKQLGKGAIAHQTTTLYQGVLPPPEMMEHFAKIDPSLPGRIMKMAEEEGESRRKKEKSIINKSFTLDIISTLCGVLSVFGVIWLCYQFIIKGYHQEAGYVATGVIVSLAIIFVLRRKPKQNNNKF